MSDRDPRSDDLRSNDEMARAEQILARILELDTESMPAALEKACRENPDCARSLRQAFQLMQRAGMLESAGEEFAGSEVIPAKTKLPEIEGIRVLEKLGTGGMGDVWLAEQLEPVKRKVAVKLIKRGMDTGRILSRFESERQALARMSHPCIAQVHGAGTTKDGLPYFLMEYVAGVPIHDYSDQKKLSLHARLALFQKVCTGVQHAHQKGIIHRDLKPSNILVVEDQGEAIPKIIDFGIAKAIEEKLTEETVTQFGSVIGTPEYMSPEQAMGDPGDIDTRSDVYSLGVVLYELLTGALPFDTKELRRLALPEVIQTIREVVPPKPSTRLGTARTSTETAGFRHSTTTSLQRQVRGDLDWITMRTLEKDRERRYASATELAADVQRFLDHEPVLAGPPSTFYRLRKFIRRNRMRLGLVGSVLVSLLVASGAYLWVRHDEQTRRLDATKRIATAVGEIRRLQGLAEAAAIDNLRPWRRVRDELEHARSLASGIGELQDQIRSLEEELAASQGKAERRAQEHARDTQMRQRLTEIPIPTLEGIDTAAFDPKADAERKTGEYARAFAEYRISMEGEVGAVANVLRTTRLAAELSVALDDWAAALHMLGKHGDAERLQWISLATDEDPWRTRLREILLARDRDLKALKDLADSAKPGEMAIPSVIVLTRAFASPYWKTQKPETELAVMLLTRAWHAQPSSFVLALELAWLHGSLKHFEPMRGFARAALAEVPNSAAPWHILGWGACEVGDLDEAIQAIRKAVSIRPDLAAPWCNLGNALMQIGELNQAIDACRKAIGIKPDLAQAWSNLGGALMRKGELDEAMKACRKAIGIKPNLAQAWINLAGALTGKGNLDEAIQACRKAIAIEPNAAEVWAQFGNTLRENGELDEAIQALRKAVGINPEDAKAWRSLGFALREKGEPDEAIQAARKATQIKPDNHLAWYLLGVLLRDKGKLNEAIGAFRKSTGIRQNLAEAWSDLGGVLLEKDELDEAMQVCRRAIGINRRLAPAWYNLGVALKEKGKLDEAMQAFREAIGITPNDADAWFNLGATLKGKGKLDEAIQAYRKVIGIRPNDANAWTNLGNVFARKGNLEEAIHAYRKATSIDRGHWKAWDNLGIAFRKKGELDDALAAHRRAISIKPDHPDLWCHLGNVLYHQRKLDEAIHAYRQATRIKPDDANAWYNLANFFMQKSELSEAIRAYRKTIDLSPNYAQAWCNCGHALTRQGRYRDALGYLQRGHEIGSGQRGWRYPSARWVMEARELVKQEELLLRIVRGDSEAQSPSAAAFAAEVAYRTKLQARATELYQQAFKDKQDLLNDLQRKHRYNAACCAALAASGKGSDVAKLGAKQRGALRAQALTWLKADLSAWRAQLTRGRTTNVIATMRHWQEDRDLSGVRDEKGLENLAAEERLSWEALWKEVDTLRKKAESARER